LQRSHRSAPQSLRSEGDPEVGEGVALAVVGHAGDDNPEEATLATGPARLRWVDPHTHRGEIASRSHKRVSDDRSEVVDNISNQMILLFYLIYNTFCGRLVSRHRATTGIGNRKPILSCGYGRLTPIGSHLVAVSTLSGIAYAVDQFLIKYFAKNTLVRYHDVYVVP